MTKKNSEPTAAKVEKVKAKKPPRYAPGDLVLVEHGSSKRGQVAVVVGIAPGVVEVKKYTTASESFGAPVEVPLWKLKGKPDRTDERAKAARALLGMDRSAK